MSLEDTLQIVNAVLDHFEGKTVKEIIHIAMSNDEDRGSVSVFVENEGHEIVRVKFDEEKREYFVVKK